ncbi:MAG: hypothetical protein KBC36_02180 [Spirochaetia bacterium]|nr:hypothetical protein [Spirochaetia bacterium]
MKRFRYLGLALLVALTLFGCKQPDPIEDLSSAKDVISFTFLAADNAGLATDAPAALNEISGDYEAGPLPGYTNVGALVASFELAAGATLKVGAVEQISGETANDFSAPVTYTVVAEDGSTSTFDVSVLVGTMEITDVIITGAALLSAGEADVVIDDTVTPRTIVAHIPGHAASEIGALKLDFTHTGLGITVDTVAHVDETSTYDFTDSATTPLVFTLNGQPGVSETYNVTVIADPVSTVATLDSFSIAVDGFVCEGTIDDTVTPGTVAVSVPSGSAVTSLVATFTSSAWSTVTAGTMPMVPQESGVTANDFTAPVTYTVTAEDGTTAKDYTVTVTPNPVAAQLMEFQPSYSSIYVQGGKEWFDIKLLDLVDLGAGWKLKAANDSYVNTLLDSSLATVIPAAVLSALVDGDIIRLHAKGYTPVDTTTKADDGVNVDRWDLTTDSTYFTNYKHAIIWIERADGSVADLVAYTTAANTSNAWLSGTGLATLQAAVAAGQWPGDTIDDAFHLGDSTINSGRLVDAKFSGGIDGNKATDWVQYQAPKMSLANPAVSPNWAQVTASAGATVTITVDAVVYGDVTINSVTADLSNAVFGGTAAQAMFDDGTNGDATSGDKVYSLEWTLPAGTVTEGDFPIAISADASVAVSGVSIDLAVSPNPAPSAPILAITNGDMETDLAGTWASSGWTDAADANFDSTIGHSGATTRAMHVKGTAGSNISLFTTTETVITKPFGYSKLTFWLRTDAATIPEVINLVLGTATSSIPAGQLFKLNGDISSDLTVLPNSSSGSFSYDAYSGSTGGTWIKVSLDISNTDTANVLRLRIGSNAAQYDFWIDDLYFEP